MTIRSKKFLAIFLFLVGMVAGAAATTRLQLVSIGGAVSPPIENRSSAEPSPSGIEPVQIFAEVSGKVTPAVVNISTTRRSAEGNERLEEFPFSNDPFFKRFFGDRNFQRPEIPRERSLGSGVIVDPQGYIITNDHVVSKADEIKVVMNDQREFKGKLIGSDPKSDLALIKVEGKDLPTVPWGNSAGLRTGEYVLAVGNPFGLNQTVTMGIVSAVGRANVGIADYEDFIQTDAAINPGNSGGALVNVRGELIGINTAIFSRSGGYMGIGFAVPSDMAKSVMDSLVKTGTVRRGWIGISIQEVTPGLAKEFGLSDPKGALIGDVMPKSPAEQAGLKRGDVIVEFNGKEIKNTGQLRNLVASTPIGNKAKLKVLRDGREKELEVTLDEQSKEGAAARPDDEEKATPSALNGVQVLEMTPGVAREIGLSGQEGVIVDQVRPNSPAREAGLQRGDVILEVNRNPIKDPGGYREMRSKLEKDDGVLLLINRQGRTLFLRVG